MTKKRIKIARALFKKSLDKNGILSSYKVHQILMAISKEKPLQVAGILKAYRRLVVAKLKKEEVEVEMAQPIKTKNLEKIILKSTSARRIVFKTNPNLIIGAKVTHGDWIWDETLDAKLGQLTQTAND